MRKEAGNWLCMQTDDSVQLELRAPKVSIFHVLIEGTLTLLSSLGRSQYFLRYWTWGRGTTGVFAATHT